MATADNPNGTRAKDKAAVEIPPSLGNPPPPTDPGWIELEGAPAFCWKFKSGVIIAMAIMPAPNAPAACAAVSNSSPKSSGAAVGLALNK